MCLEENFMGHKKNYTLILNQTKKKKKNTIHYPLTDKNTILCFGHIFFICISYVNGDVYPNCTNSK